MGWWGVPPPMWGMAWIFLLMGLLFVVIMCFVVFRLMCGRPGFCGGSNYDEKEDLKREVRQLKVAIEKLREKQ